jgi:hypothetical protein
MQVNKRTIWAALAVLLLSFNRNDGAVVAGLIYIACCIVDSVKWFANKPNAKVKSV